MLGRFAGLWLNEELALEADSVLVIHCHTQKYREVVWAEQIS